MKILLINNIDEDCGVGNFGARVFKCLKPSSLFEIIHQRCDSFEDVVKSITDHQPTHILLNKHVSTLNFIQDPLLQSIKAHGIKIMLMPHDEKIQYGRDLIDHVFWLDPTRKDVQAGESILGRPILPVSEAKSENGYFSKSGTCWIFK